ncbi:MAG TPA: kelch repeat-containing protein, partial [bacterium]|nr:kelch repeat-containing protein [bacterium]
SIRTDPEMVYDSVCEKVTLFGGSSGAYYDDTWEWDGVNWAQMDPATDPAGRSAHAMAYDSSRAKAVLFGGFTGSVFSDETWEWGENRWEQKNTGNKPPVLMNHAVAYDAARGKTILFGGASEVNTYNETWLWDGGAHDRSGQIMTVSRESSGITDDGYIQSLSVLFHAGGLGDITGTPTNGVDLLTWKHDSWVTVASNEADPDHLEPVTWATTDNTEIQTLLNSGLRKFNFAVVPTAPNGFLTDMGTIATDYAEVIVRYTISEE